MKRFLILFAKYFVVIAALTVMLVLMLSFKGVQNGLDYGDVVINLLPMTIPISFFGSFFMIACAYLGKKKNRTDDR